MTAIYVVVGSGISAAALIPAAIAGWHRLLDFHDRHTERPSQQPIQPSREPIAAITAAPHRPDTEPDTQEQEHGRHYRQNITHVDPWHRLSPAGYQYATRTDEQVPADVDQPTGVLDRRLVVAAGGAR